MKQPIFTGVATALVTPFRDGAVDLATFDRLLDAQLAAGIDALVICGTTGEGSTLSTTEQLTLIAHAIRYASGRCKVIAGCGSNDTSHALELSQTASAMGADGLLLVTPYYNKCTQDGLLAHYLTIADAVTCPIIAYSVPGRTGMDISVETCVRLSQHPNINGIKEAGGDTSKAARILNECGGDFFLWSGNDDQISPLIALGARGVISVLSNVLPGETSLICKKFFGGDVKGSMELQKKYLPLINALFSEVNPIPAKAAMAKLGYTENVLRPPLCAMEETHAEKLYAEMRALGLI